MVTANNKTNILSIKELSIQISLNGLSFCVLNTEANSICYLKHIPFSEKQTPFNTLDHLKDAFNNEEALQDSFRTIHVIYVNELSTLVPKPLFEEDAIADYLKFNTKILQTDFIAQDEIHINDSINIYVPYVNINNYLYDRFGTFNYKHYSTILIEEILQAEKHAEDKKMYVHISDTHFEIIVSNQGKLTLYNTFNYNTAEDFIYYILFTAEQLQLNPETVKLVLLGNIKEDDSLYNIAYKYIRHIQFGKTNTNYLIENTEELKHNNYILKHIF